VPGPGVTGSLAGEVATIGKKQSTNKLVFPAPNIREIAVKSGSVEPVLSGYLFAQFTAQGTDELTFEEALEVM
jgi:hypothetical protein